MIKKPILFEANELSFNTNGIGVLSEALQCDVTEEINGIFELFMVYPSFGKFFSEIRNDRIVYADASHELGMQPFRITRVNKLMNGFVNVYAQHISYDLGGVQLPPFTTKGTSDGMTKVKQYATTETPFLFQTYVVVDEDDEANTFTTSTPKSIRAYLMGTKDSYLKAYGGEFLFDKFRVSHASSRGSDKGFRVRYGVNLVDLNQEESIEKTYTGFYPYYKDEYMFMDLNESYDLAYPHEIDASKLPGKIMYADGNFSHQKVANIDLSPYFEIAPLSTDELREVAEKYAKENKIGVPAISLDIRFEELKKFKEFSNIPSPEDISLGDTIHVDFAKLNISAKGRINTIVYDSLRHQNKRVQIGDVKNSIADTIVQTINTQKTSVLSSDKINMTGYVTFTGLGKDGTTEIDGGRIKTGQIRSQNFSDPYMILIRSLKEPLSEGNYWYELYTEENSTRYISISKSIPEGGQIVYVPSENKVYTYSADDTLLENITPSIDELDNAQYLEIDMGAYFSESGTAFDLDSGEIISPQFSVKKDQAFFGGVIRTDHATLGKIAFSKDSFGAIAMPKKLGVTANGVYTIYFDGTYTYLLENLDSGERISCQIGDVLSSAIKFQLSAKNGEKTNEIYVDPNNARISGEWKATPYTDRTADPSEIVTKSDLIELGLI